MGNTNADIYAAAEPYILYSLGHAAGMNPWEPPFLTSETRKAPTELRAGLAVAPAAVGVVLSLNELFGDPAPRSADLSHRLIAQLALLGIEAAYLLAAAEAFLADVADLRKLRFMGRLAGMLGLARAGARLALFATPILAGAWLAVSAGLPAASVLLDRDGRLIRYYYPAGEYRLPVSAEGISPWMKLAIDAIEDPGAHSSPSTHIPISPVRLAGILATAARALQGQGAGELSGASGIAVQGCKNFFGRPPVGLVLGLPDWLPARTHLAAAATLVDKLAFEFPCGWTFERLSLLLGSDRSSVTFYLNAVYFGRGAYGVEAASLTYFGKPAKELSAAEAALLAGLPQAPSALDPWANPDGVRARRGQVLSAMVREGYLSPGEAAAIHAGPLGVEGSPWRPSGEPEGMEAYVLYLMEWLEGRGYRNLSTAGLVLTLSVDPARQRELEAEIRRSVASLESRRVNNGAAVVLDPHTGEILAWVGGLQPLHGPGALPDMVSRFPHQPGSALKPLLYACALEMGALRPEERLDDTPRVIGGRYIANWDLDPKGRGMRPAREELADSRNTAAAALVERLTPEGFVACLRDRFHVRTDLEPRRHGVELGLGLAEMPMLEIAAAYTVLANGGVYAEPTPVRRIVARDGRELYRARPPEGPEVLSRPTLGWMWQALYAVSEKLGIPGEAATKTGTTPSSSFAMGYTEELLMAAWLGRTEPGRGRLEIGDVEGREAAWALWRAQAAPR